jgi:hypothetical protein
MQSSSTSCRGMRSDGKTVSAKILFSATHISVGHQGSFKKTQPRAQDSDRIISRQLRENETKFV